MLHVWYILINIAIHVNQLIYIFHLNLVWQLMLLMLLLQPQKQHDNGVGSTSHREAILILLLLMTQPAYLVWQLPRRTGAAELGFHEHNHAPITPAISVNECNAAAAVVLSVSDAVEGT